METRSVLISNIFQSEILIPVAIFLWIYWLWQRRPFYRFCWNFPTLWGLPILGHLTKVNNSNTIYDAMASFFESKQSDTVVAWAGTHPLLLTKDTQFIDFLLTGREFLDKSELLYHSLFFALRGGLIANPGKNWQPIRPLLEPCFNRQTLLSFFPIFNQQKATIIANLEPFDDGKSHNMLKTIYDGVLELTLQTTMGISLKDKNSFSKDFVKDFRMMIEGISVKMFAGFLNLSWLISSYRLKETKSIQKFIENLVHRYVEKGKNDKNEDAVSSNIFIKHAIKLYENNQLTWQDITAESTTMFNASFETTGMAVFSTIALLAMHPDIAEKVHEELRSVFPDPKCDIKYEDLCKLPYLDIVLKESLRLIPPVSFIGRHIRQDTKYKDWPVVIPKNMQVLICIFHLHRHTGIWGPDATEFKPSRFLEENLTKAQFNAYMPFSKGYRNCLGYRYAQLSIKVMLAGILLNFKFGTDFKLKDLKFANHILTQYMTEPKLVVKKRELIL